MNPIKANSYEQAIELLQQIVDERWHRNPRHLRGELPKRSWLKAIPVDSYSQDRYRVELWVLEGSPPKEIVLINHFRQEIRILDSISRVKKIIRWGSEWIA